MKVLQIIDQLKTGGAERVAVDLSILLSKEKNINLTFLCLLSKTDIDQEIISNGIKIIYLNRKNKYNPYTLLKLLRIINNYDVVHIHLRQVMRYIGLLYYFPFKIKCKIVFHDHYGQIATDKDIAGLLKNSIQNADAFIGVSNTLVNWAKVNKLNSHIYLLSNIVRKETETKKVNQATDLVVVGNFRPQKNYEYLCELVSKLPQKITVDLYATISDKNYYNKICGLIKEFQIEDKLNIIIGNRNVSKLLSNYKLGLHCASSETGPLVAIEYLSQGLPFIMYNTGEVATVLENNKYQLLMNNFEIKEWISKIENIISNQEELKELATKTEKIYTSNFSERKYIQKCLSIYNEVYSQE